MQALKALVIFMGLLIAAGVGLLIYAVAGNLPSERTRGFAETAVALPGGCVIADAVVSAGILVLRTDGPAERGCQQVILLDPDSGREIGRVRAEERP